MFIRSALLFLIALASSARAAETWATIKPILEDNCWNCHADGESKGEVVLDKDDSPEAILANRKLWSAVQFHTEQWTMPPAERKQQPAKAERDRLVQWLDTLLNPVDPSNPDPGRVTIRRLNRVEYNNTVRDLLGTTSAPADDFPEDDTGYGFDNIGDVLALAPVLMERYLIAADRILAEAIPLGPPLSTKQRFDVAALNGPGFPMEKARLLAFNAETTTEYSAPVAGDYILRVGAWSDPAGNEPAKLELRHAGKTALKADVTATGSKNVQSFETVISMKRGFQKIAAAFTNDAYNPNEPDPQKRDRNLYIAFLEVEGPVKAAPLPLGLTAQRIFSPANGRGETDEVAREVLEKFAHRAFRRAVLPAEVERLMSIYRAARKESEPWRDSLRIAFKAVLISPYFLYRIEWQPDANNPAKIVDLNDFALASRLSYWLWSTTPDDELLSLAFRNQLKPQLAAQIQRMLRDPKARALPENFGGQWLELRSLDVVAPDKERFPEYTPELSKAMRQETNDLFWHIIQQQRPLTEFVTADYTFLNEPLAKFYKIPGVVGADFRRVSVPADSVRGGGVLTHASVLTVTSDSLRTSPVKRGKWLLENILGVTAPPPPPNVPALEEGEHIEAGASVRQRLEMHRSKPGCVSCHALIDPLGFGLEGFNAIGQAREKDGNFPIDSTGVLTTGQKFSSARELSTVILNDKKDIFLRNVIKKMFTYALGRGPEPYDRPALDEIRQKMAQGGDTFASMAIAIAESVPFQKRRGDKPN
jgi:hypothetical protein